MELSNKKFLLNNGSFYTFCIKNGNTLFLERNSNYARVKSNVEDKTRMASMLIRKKEKENLQKAGERKEVSDGENEMDQEKKKAKGNGKEKEKEKGKANGSIEKDFFFDNKDPMFLKNIKNSEEQTNIKYELLTTNHILDLLFFIIHSNTSISLLSQLYTELFFRIHRNINFSRKQFERIFHSIWLSRVYHLNLLETLIDIISKNKKIIDNVDFCLHILLCVLSYKYERKYENLITELFEYCFQHIEYILKNIKKQIHFYYCFIFLETYYPLLFYKINKNKQYTHVYEINDSLKMLLTQRGGQLHKRKSEKSESAYSGEEEMRGIIQVEERGKKNKNKKEEGEGEEEEEEEEEETEQEEKENIEKENNSVEREPFIYFDKSNIIKHLNEVFYNYEKKRAYSFDIFYFCEMLDKLQIMKLQIKNSRNVYIKNYEINNMFILNVYFPLMKFGILFSKDRDPSKGKNNINIKLKKIIEQVPNCRENTKIERKDKVKKEEKETEIDKKEQQKIHKKISSSSNSSYDYFYPYEHDIHMIASKCYLQKMLKINVMIIPVEKVELFFKAVNKKRQDEIIFESNVLFEKVYEKIEGRKEVHFDEFLGLLSSLFQRQLQFIYQLI